MLITKVPLKVITLHNVSIFDQLKMEEYLLRDTTDNYCIINQGSPPSIVMGISGVVGDLVYEKKLEEAKIPLIKRFSGGGTVVVFPDNTTALAGNLKRLIGCLAPDSADHDHVRGDRKGGVEGARNQSFLVARDHADRKVRI